MARNEARCPDCDCPNRHCACVLRTRVELAERDRNRAVAEAARWRALFQAAASLVAHNRDRLRAPRGKDEARVLAYLDETGAPGLGPFWSGRTDGWIEDDWPVQGELALVAATDRSESDGEHV